MCQTIECNNKRIKLILKLLLKSIIPWYIYIFFLQCSLLCEWTSKFFWSMKEGSLEEKNEHGNVKHWEKSWFAVVNRSSKKKKSYWAKMGLQIQILWCWTYSKIQSLLSCKRLCTTTLCGVYRDICSRSKNGDN